MPHAATFWSLPSSVNAREWRFILLAALIVLVYAPSFYHAARGDQINYLAEMASRHGFIDTVFGTFDLNRTRVFAAGDELAFRPLFYLILGLQKYVFGYGMFWWQVFSLGAHIFATGALYALLCRVQGGAFALAATAFFAFLPVNIEAVVWTHISPYVIFAGCVLMVLKEIHALGDVKGIGGRHEAAILGWLLPVSFLYETGVWYALVIGWFLWRRGRRCGAWGAWGLSGLSLALNMAQLGLRGIDSAVLSGWAGLAGKAQSTPYNAAFLFKWFLTAPLFLDGNDLLIRARTMVRPEAVSWSWPLGAPLSWTIGCGVLLTLVGVWRFFSRPRRDGRPDLGALCLVMAAGYALVIVLGRINPEGPGAIGVAPYYAYNFLILIFAAVAFFSGQGAGNRAVRSVVVTATCLAVSFNIMSVSSVTQHMAGAAAADRALVIALERFVRAHVHEPDFSFYMPSGDLFNRLLPSLTRRGDAPGRSYALAEALYPQYFDKVRPKYIINGDARF